MGRSALVVRHVAFEDLGILAPLLARRGFRTDYVQAGVDPLTPAAVLGADLLVVLGGPIGVGDQETYPFLEDEIGVVAARLEHGAPTLGICLGAQVMATALGAEVAPTGRVEIGYAPLTLTDAGLAGPLALLGDTPVLHWHGDQFGIPEGTQRLASTPGFPNQAFSRGTDLLALQFHLEADHTLIERWLIGHAHELASHGIDPRELRAQAARSGPQLATRATAVLTDWFDNASL